PANEEVELGRAFAPAQFAAPDGGRFIVRARTLSGPDLRADAVVYVWNVRSKSLLEIKPKERAYAGGDVAQLELTGAFAGARGLLAVDAGGNVRVQPIDPGTKRIELPIAPNWVPSVQGRVALRKDGASATAWVKLPVSPSKQEMVVSVTSSAHAPRPGDVVNVEVRAAPGAGVVLSVIDRAALEMMPPPYSAVAPLQALFRPDWFEASL